MIINGKQLAEGLIIGLKSEIKKLDLRPVVAVLALDSDPVSLTYVNFKKKLAENLGIKVDVYRYDDTVKQGELVNLLKTLGKDETVNGIIIQLPLPVQFDLDELIDLIPRGKDIDSLGPRAKMLAPVAGAIAEILKQFAVDYKKSEVVVVGNGRLVGRPVFNWLVAEGVKTHLITKKDWPEEEYLKSADIIISGSGSPHLIKPDMIKEGVVLIDAGTSESSGVLKGDIDPGCQLKAKLFTPVPNGVGPIALVKLFSNLVELIKSQK